MPVKDVHVRSLAASTALSSYYVEKQIAPLEVIKILNGAGARFVLCGAHGLAGWMKKPRATEDVDVVVAARSHKKALKALLEAFSHLQPEDTDVVTRLRDPEDGVVRIDLMKPTQALFKAALAHTCTVESKGQTYQIPSLEMALAMKFAPMISLNRPEEDRLIDGHDFIYIIKSNPDIDLEKLAELGELVYSGGGKEILERVRQVRAGERLTI